MSDWAFAVGAWGDAAPFHRLATATDRKVSVRLDAPGEATCEIDGRSEDALVLEVLSTDLWVYRDGGLVFRGRVVAAPETINTDRHRISITATDYRGMLGRRMLLAEQTYALVTQADIAWGLVQATQDALGGDLGITRGVTEAGPLRDRTYKVGDNIGDRIAELGRVDGGFEWWVTPALSFELAARRGQDTSQVLDYGGTVAALTRESAADAYANAVLATGGAGTIPAGQVATGADAPDVDPRGRWEAVRSFPTVIEQPTLDTKAVFLLAEGVKPPVAYSLTLAPGVWPDDVNLSPGDTAVLRLRSGRRDEQATVRVEELTVDLDDSGVEAVSVAATAASMDLSRGLVP